jgi:phytoene dehydrogenase-like protein
VLFPRDYDAEFDDVFGRPQRGVLARPARDPAVYIAVADDPLVRPDGHEAWFVLVNAPPHGDNAAGVDWTVRATALGYADRILDVLAARGVEVRDRVLFLVGGSVHPGGDLPMVLLSAKIVAGQIGSA